jgi:hypothetical protein
MKDYETAWNRPTPDPPAPGSRPVLGATSFLHIRPWADTALESTGHDPRSAYVETFWLPVLGPSTTWLLRRLAAVLDANPEGTRIDLADTARRLGLGHRGGRSSPFMRSLARCVAFDMAQPRGPGVLAVRRRVPPLGRRQLLRLPPSLQESHLRWQQARPAASRGSRPAAIGLQRRAMELAARQSGDGRLPR